MPAIFDHEKLIVYCRTVEFIAWVGELIPMLPKGMAVTNQLDRASTSIALNIAEGNGKSTMRDRCRYLDIAYGSSLECASCLDVVVARKMVQVEDARRGKELLREIVSMLVGLINKLSDGVREERGEYQVREAEEYE